MPPKLIINVASNVAQNKGKQVAISKQPFVISTIPLKNIATKFGKIENIGVKEVITTKNTAIIVPTEITLKEVSKTIEFISILFFYFNISI